MSDSLGRAGRLRPDGRRVKVERVREMTAEDRRRVTVTDNGLHDTLLEVVTPEQGELADDGHRALVHLAGAEDRPPLDWEEANSFARRLAWAGGLDPDDPKRRTVKGERERLTDELRRDRAQKQPWERLRDVVQDIGTLQTVRAARIAENDADARPGISERSRAPQGEGAGAIGFIDPHEVDRRLRLISLHTEAIEDLLDVHRGYTTKSYVLMSTAEKNALITGPQLRGLHVREIHALHPELGAERTLRYVRSQAGQDVYGNERPARREAA